MLRSQVIALAGYRGQLYEYLKSRMMAIAPNLTVLVGELVGARLIAHAGSLVNLAKAPASTVQILGAEKALFRALKTKHEVSQSHPTGHQSHHACSSHLLVCSNSHACEVLIGHTSRPQPHVSLFACGNHAQLCADSEGCVCRRRPSMV